MTDSVKFTDLGLSEPILKAITELGYETPSPIQAQGIPAVLKGSDLMAAAQTGTGKTAGFTLPLLDILSKGALAKNNQARALVLTPTRELAAQIRDSVALYGKYLPLTTTVVFGGVKVNPQMKRLTRGVDILVATPGRLLDLYQQKAVRFDDLEVLILDEADRMLDMGFVRDIRKILALLPKKRQNLLFSATFSPDIRALAKTMVNNPVEISVATRNTTAETVEQSIYTVDKNKKSGLLIALIKQYQWPQILVFSRTKHGANRLSKQLNAAGIKADAIHGNKSQGARTRALADFKDNKTQVLVATDIAARGIDIDQLPQVINVDLPNVPEDYVHRIGRTGRAGSTGEAISLVSADEFKELSMIERLIKKVLDRKVFDGFEAIKPVPESRLDTRPIKASKPKKPKSQSRGGAQNRSSSSKQHSSRASTSNTTSSSKRRAPRANADDDRSANSSAKAKKTKSNDSPQAQANRSSKPAAKTLAMKNKKSRIKDFGNRGK